MENGRKWLKGFGERLRLVREKQGISRVDLAKLADIDHSYLRQIESGVKSPSLRLLRNIVSALGVSADRLLFENQIDEGEAHAVALKDFTNFLEKRNGQEIEVLMEIAKSVIKYKELSDKP